ncbi:uncharacterized protein LOC117647732 [Thrips palmi]|uniref:Uncharacterized protein LOC117647732 n=1 Tax=Thrips palmi TaxID=161013 RepID=A0A6P8Z5X1_THRPL|nr:uncharacterized protein LOC117647732 [Thrips palmi]
MNVESVLRADSVGNEIVESYQAHDCDDPASLSESQRHKIVQVLIENIRANTENFDFKLLAIVSKKIVELFPSECEATYYIGPKEQGPKQVTALGRLSNRLRNCRSKPKPKNPSLPDKIASNLGSILEKPITEEIEEAKAWLSTGRCPWPEVLRKWTATAPLRFKALFHGDDDYINSYLKEWPVLTHKSGFELFLADFALLYPRSAELLHLRWDRFVRITKDIAFKDIKDKNGKDSLKLLQQNPNKESEAAIVLTLLPHIRPGHKASFKGEVRKVSALEARKSFFLHLTVAADFKRKVKEHRLSVAGPGGSPLLVVVGPTLLDIKSVYVSVADLDYKVDSVVEGLDIFFKSHHALHTSYHCASSHIWTTLQRAVYSFETEWDCKNDIKHSWIHAYKFN